MEAEGFPLPDFVAGHSLGEYSALTTAGALELAQTAKLLKVRGKAMQKAVPVGVGAMAAILGLDLPDVLAVAKRATADSTSHSTAIAGTARASMSRRRTAA